jgi:predicted P-loop ATPase
VSRRDADRVKQFQSRRVDRIRPPYGRNAIDVPRQCVFIGTTNEVQYLRDPTGARRFMPIRCGRVDLQWLKENREQLLAEAWQRLQDGEGWWEFPETEALAEQEERYEGDPWEEPIDRFLALNQAVTIADVLRDAVKLEVSRQDKAAQMRAATVLARLGWRKAHAGPAGRRRRVWMKAEDVHHQGGALEGKVVQLKTASDQSGAPREPPAPPVQEDRNNT